MWKMCEDVPLQRNWHLQIPNLLTVINSSVSSTRGFSPFFLTFFRHANFPFQKLKSQTITNNENSTVTARFNMAQDTLQQCHDVLGLSFEAAKARFDKKHQQQSFQPGDTVFVETRQRNLLHKKFADRYKGPYKVLELLSNNNIKLIPLDNSSPSNTQYLDPFHFLTIASQLPPFFRR